MSFIWRRRSSMLLSSARGFRHLLRLGRGGAGARRHERLEHREGLLEQFHVAADMFFERRERRSAECVGQLLAEFFLLARQRVDRLLEIFRHHHLHAVAVEADQLPQERGRQQVLAGLVFLLEDDLRQHRAGDVVAGLGVVDEEILAVLHHRREILERHIGAGAGIIEPPVGVFLDRGGCVLTFAMGSHIHTESGNPTASPQGGRATQRSKVSIFNAVRLPFCAARLITKHRRCSGNRQGRHFECAAAEFRQLAD